MHFQFAVLGGKNIVDIAQRNIDSVYEVVRSAYIDHDLNKTIDPQGFYLYFPGRPNARIIAKASALVGDGKIAGMKWIGSNPDNVKHGFPRASATIILNDYETCYPIVCIEGSVISVLRTSYSAVLGAEEIKRGEKKIIRLGIIGCGLIAKYIYDAFLAQQWEIDEILLFDNNYESSNRLALYIKETTCGSSVLVSSTLADLLTRTDLVVLTTAAASPYVLDIKLFAHNPVILNISLRDLAPEVLLGSNNIVDDVEHVLCANTSPHLTLQICGHKNFINGTLGQLLNRKIMLPLNKPTIFSPMGMGMLDIALAYYLYKQALIENQLTFIDNFFYEEQMT